ncbi:hypothetical protein [Halomicrobium urmianum]|uniref:hypothetical protein n=1 Tax=Halomicrobium urmianum TaxID=1586233 RepID=UPI001CDA5481|nr:hypothetical protein [Halomicrobium urmianum]
MQRRNFLKRTLASTALLGATSAASARRTATKSEASVEFATWGPSVAQYDGYDVSRSDDGRTITVTGTVTGPTNDPVELTDFAASLDDGVLTVVAGFNEDESGVSRRTRSRRGTTASAVDYEVTVATTSEPAEVEVVHELQVSGFGFRITDSSVGTENDATVRVDGTDVSVDGTIQIGTCYDALLDDVTYHNGRLTLSVATAAPPEGTVCTLENQLEYEMSGSVSSEPETVVVEHDGEVVAKSS